LINAFANYFKHGDEWNGSWSALTGQSKQTADVISAVGAQEFSTGNLCAGGKALGLADDDPGPLAGYVRQWVEAVLSTYEAELKRIKLI